MTSQSTGLPPCRFFAQGCCTKGALCSFAHNADEPSAVPCKFFMEGQCRYASQCRFSHATNPHAQPHTNKFAPVVLPKELDSSDSVASTTHFSSTLEPMPTTRPTSNMPSATQPNTAPLACPNNMGSVAYPVAMAPMAYCNNTMPSVICAPDGMASRVYVPNNYPSAPSTCTAMASSTQSGYTTMAPISPSALSTYTTVPIGSAPHSYTFLPQQPQHINQVNQMHQMRQQQLMQQQMPQMPQMQQMHPQQQPQEQPQPQQQQQMHSQQQQQQMHHQQHQHQHQQQHQHHQHHQHQQHQHQHQQQQHQQRQQHTKMQMQHSCQRQSRRECRSDAEDAGTAESIACGICYEPLNAKRGDKRFGMLENCDHFFCLDCIREWRKTGASDGAKPAQKQNARLCPVCRVESFVVIPADRHLCGEDKKAIMKEYKGNMNAIPCKFWDYGRGSCSFGASCFYAHCNIDGTRYVPPPQRSVASDGGKTRILAAPTLLDFLPTRN